MKYLLMVLFLALASCHDSESGGEGLASGTPTVDEEAGVTFSGFIVSAFEVTVDGVEYADMEDFYTQELDRLPAKVREAGYGEEYAVKFAADIGFTDLWESMTVYTAPVNNRGYQGVTKVGRNGEFSVKMPANAIDDEYKVRGNKRISVVLSTESEQIKICYNFSAVDKSVLFTESDKPIILSTFTTSLTKYECEEEAGSGVVVPGATEVGKGTSPASSLLAPGMTKAEILASLGSEELIINSSTMWCYKAMSYSQPSTVCAVNYADACQCHLEFDAQGLLIDQYNIKSTLLDILKW